LSSEWIATPSDIRDPLTQFVWEVSEMLVLFGLRAPIAEAGGAVATAPTKVAVSVAARTTARAARAAILPFGTCEQATGSDVLRSRRSTGAYCRADSRF
jgi:hypothetical protein